MPFIFSTLPTFTWWDSHKERTSACISCGIWAGKGDFSSLIDGEGWRGGSGPVREECHIRILTGGLSPRNYSRRNSQLHIFKNIGRHAHTDGSHSIDCVKWIRRGFLFLLHQLYQLQWLLSRIGFLPHKGISMENFVQIPSMYIYIIWFCQVKWD